MIVINADNLILGRMAATVAKKALLGEDVNVVNCEKAVIIGNRDSIIDKYLHRLELGQPQQGPFIQRRPDLFVRRAIGGMLPRSRSRGLEALRKIKCYMGVPKEFAGKEITLKDVQSKKTTKESITVADLCISIGDTKRFP